ncbi:unnamed protein product, partial [marine sediment metagenome]
MASLEKSVDIVLKECMNVKANESILIIVDKLKKQIGEIFKKKSDGLKLKTKLIEIPVGKINGEEPPNDIAEEMFKYDVILLLTTKSLSHTKARRDACKNGARIASMPGITEDIMSRLDVDYEEMEKRISKIKELLTKGSGIKIITKKGTNISFSIIGRDGKTDTGIYTQKGDFGNLPAGEAAIAPLEGTTNGCFVVDAS